MANTLAYGFVGLENLMAQRLSDSNVAIVRDAIAQSVAEHNRQVVALTGELVDPTEAYKIRFRQPGAGTLQPLDDKGNPLPVREGAYYDVAFPIQGAGTAFGDNRVTRALMSVEEVNEHVLNSLYRDADWMKRHILAALFDNVAWTFTDKLYGALTIQPLANSDAVTYLKTNGTTAADTHYLAQAAAIADATNPYSVIYTELMEHPVNQGAEVVAYIPSNLVATTEALAAFLPVLDPNTVPGITNDRLGGSTGLGMGQELLGKVSKVWVVEWSNLPDNYIVAVARGTQKKVLRMREYPSASLKGLFQETNNVDGNSLETRFIRYAGFGALNRVGAVVYRIGNASYAIPTGYDAPLAV